MSREAYKAKARKHWEKWRPKEVARLRAEGTLEETLQAAAAKAHQTVLDLMQEGYQLHEAEEVALRDHVLLAPEKEAEMEPWEREESAQMEREYRKKMR